MVHWERPKVTTTPAALYAWERSTNAINIEMTSYALLTFVARGDLTNAYPVIRWLVSQRDPKGGFISTQVGQHNMKTEFVFFKLQILIYI